MTEDLSIENNVVPTDEQLSAAIGAYEEEHGVWKIYSLDRVKGDTSVMIEDAVRQDMINPDELHTITASDTYTFNRLTFKSIGDAKCYIHEEAMKVALTAALNTRT